MARRQARKPVDKRRYRQYMDVAEHFFAAAGASRDLEYWTAAGVLIVHAAIAYTDALCVMLSGQKSAGEDHEDSIALLDSVVADDAQKQKALSQLRRIIEEKTRVSYLGELYGQDDISEMLKRLERFRTWARGILNR